MERGVERFGKVEFLPVKRRLVVAGRGVDLDRPAAAILHLLLQESPADVDKHRLLEAGWSGRMVDENSLPKAISRLRVLLGEDGKALETVHGYGYRIAADVETASYEEGKDRPILQRRFRPVLASLAVALIAVVAWQAASPLDADSDAATVINGEPRESVGRILWVDDHPQNNVAEKRFLEHHGIGVYQVATTADALKLLDMYAYGAVVSDMGRGGRPLAGLDLLQAMRSRGDQRPFFLYTVHSSATQRKMIGEAGGQAVAQTSAELYSDLLPLFGAAEGPQRTLFAAAKRQRSQTGRRDP